MLRSMVQPRSLCTKNNVTWKMGPVVLHALFSLVIHSVNCNVCISLVLIVSRVHACDCMHVWERLYSSVLRKAVADAHVCHWLIVNIYGDVLSSSENRDRLALRAAVQSPAK
jgi:hypothetical protein